MSLVQVAFLSSPLLNMTSHVSGGVRVLSATLLNNSCSYWFLGLACTKNITSLSLIVASLSYLANLYSLKLWKAKARPFLAWLQIGHFLSFQYIAKKSVSISALVIILGNKSLTNNLCSGYLHISTAINNGVCLSFCINLASRAMLYTSSAGHRGINLLISLATETPSIYATSSQRRLASTALLSNATLDCLAAKAP